MQYVRWPVATSMSAEFSISGEVNLKSMMATRNVNQYGG